MKLPAIFSGRQKKDSARSPLARRFEIVRSRIQTEIDALRESSAPSEQALTAAIGRINAVHERIQRLTVRKDRDLANIATHKAALDAADDRRRAKHDQLALDAAAGNEDAESQVSAQLGEIATEAQVHADALAAANSRVAAFDRQIAVELSTADDLQREYDIQSSTVAASFARQAEAAWDDAVNALAVAGQALAQASAAVPGGAAPARVRELAVPYFSVSRALLGRMSLTGAPGFYGTPTLSFESLRAASPALEAGESLDAEQAGRGQQGSESHAVGP